MLRRLRADLPEYAAQCLMIRTKSGRVTPLRLNRAQRYVHAALETQRAATGGKVRALILKARQQGFSTYIGARFYHRASLNQGLRVFILTHEQEAAETLFSMVGRFHAGNPLTPRTGASNAKSMSFDRLGSGYGVLRGTVAALGKRIDALESEMGALSELKVTVAEVKTSIGFLLEQFKDLNASIRWMRDPAK